MGAVSVWDVPRLAGARTRPFVTAVSAFVAASSIVVFSADVLLRPGWFALFSVYNVAAFAAAGVLWLRQRPASRTGPLLLALSALTALSSLQGWPSSLALSIGVLVDPVLVVLVWFLILGYPAGRITRPAAATIALVAGGVAIGFVPWFFLSSAIAGGTPLAQCTGACPTNAFVVADRPDVAAHFGDIEIGFRIAFACAFLLIVIARLARATPPGRRILAPVYGVAAFWAVLFGAVGVARYLDTTNLRVWNSLAWSLTGARVALPASFLLALLLARLFAGGALTAMLRRLGSAAGPAELQRVTREVLRDPTLTISREATQPAADGRSRREVRSHGRTLAVLEYDEALDDDPELVEAAARVIVLRLERDASDSDRDAVLADLRSQQRRLAGAAAAERLKIERDLHDSAQQSIVGIRIQLAQVSERLGRDADLDRLGAALEAALEEIRSIAHGAYPATLRAYGIGRALSEGAAADPRVRLERDESSRYEPDLELTVYFAAMEAMQNAGKHAGAGSSIALSLYEDAGELVFEVRDDGPGFDAGAAPATGGLAGMRDRMRSIGGELEILTAVGSGTRVRGRVHARRAAVA